MKQKSLTPKKYIMTKARGLPFGECLINDNWQEQGNASVLVSRRMPSSKLIVGMYNIDVFCLGLKNTFFNFGIANTEMEDLKKEMAARIGSISDIAVNDAHNLIYGSIDYAEELGFDPHTDFHLTEHILNPDYIDDGIDNITFGRDGKPFYIAGPNDNVTKILTVLEMNVGEGNFDYVFPG